MYSILGSGIKTTTSESFGRIPPFSRFIPERTILGRLTLNF